jgi:HAD superfamily hydrolase (TIGR01509 family)
MKIKAIIFDCFGVLATEGLLSFRETHFGNKPELMQEARDMGRAVDAGLADYEDYLVWLAENAGVSLGQTRHQLEHNVPDKKLFTYIKQELKPRFKIGMLSNAGENWLAAIFTPEQLGLFDAIALSFETGHLKPSPEAYEAIAKKLGVELSECVFLDDQERHCAAACDTGMQAVCYRDFADAKRQLEAILSQS